MSGPQSRWATLYKGHSLSKADQNQAKITARRQEVQAHARQQGDDAQQVQQGVPIDVEQEPQPRAQYQHEDQANAQTSDNTRRG